MMTEKSRDAIKMVIALLLALNLFVLWAILADKLHEEPKVECSYHGHEIIMPEVPDGIRG